MKKIAKELKWLVVSAVIVISAIGLVIGVANLSQWRVDVNMARVDDGEIEMVGWNKW